MPTMSHSNFERLRMSLLPVAGFDTALSAALSIPICEAGRVRERMAAQGKVRVFADLDGIERVSARGNWRDWMGDPDGNAFARSTVQPFSHFNGEKIKTQEHPIFHPTHTNPETGCTVERLSISAPHRGGDHKHKPDNPAHRRNEP